MKHEKIERKVVKSRHRVAKALIIIFLLFIIAILSVGIYGWYYINSKIEMINYDNTLTEEQIEVNEGVKWTGYRNIALFGVDSREGELENNTRSDCIMVVAINQEMSDIKLISVYRDTYLNINGSLDKITHAYSYGGPKLTINSLNKNLDLDIKEYVTVNFNTLIDVVDEIGGIEIEVTKEEKAPLNQYVKDMHIEMKTPDTPISNYGYQTLNGVQALAYSRIRKIDSDYKRTERMRTVLNAIFEKVKTMNLVQLNKLADIILPEVYTNIPSKEILSLIPQVAKYNIGESIGWPYDIKEVELPTFYSAPNTLKSNVEKLHVEVFGEENYVVSDAVNAISKSITKKIGK